MVPEALSGLRGVHGPNGLARKKNASAGFGNAYAQLVIVRKRSGERLEAADSGEPAFGGNDRSTQGEVDAFRPLGHQYSGKKIAGCTDGFELRAKIWLGNAAIERGDRSDALLDEGSNNFVKGVRAHHALPHRG